MARERSIEQLLECLIHVVGRAAVPEERVRDVVATGSGQIKAFNLSDGTRTQSDIARQAGLDQGNLSRAVSRWVENGVAFWVGEGKDARLMHIYPIPTNGGAKAKGRTRTKRGKRK